MCCLISEWERESRITPPPTAFRVRQEQRDPDRLLLTVNG
jgi:hypothetical protein